MKKACGCRNLRGTCQLEAARELAFPAARFGAPAGLDERRAGLLKFVEVAAAPDLDSVGGLVVGNVGEALPTGSVVEAPAFTRTRAELGHERFHGRVELLTEILRAAAGDAVCAQVAYFSRGEVVRGLTGLHLSCSART